MNDCCIMQTIVPCLCKGMVKVLYGSIWMLSPSWWCGLLLTAKQKTQLCTSIPQQFITGCRLVIFLLLMLLVLLLFVFLRGGEGMKHFIISVGTLNIFRGFGMSVKFYGSIFECPPPITPSPLECIFEIFVYLYENLNPHFRFITCAL